MFLSTELLISCGRQKESRPNERGNTGDVKKEAKEAAQAARDYAEQQKDQYQKQIESKLKEYDQKLDELKAKAEVEEQIKKLQKKRKAASKKLEELRSASSQAKHPELFSKSSRQEWRSHCGSHENHQDYRSVEDWIQ